MSAAAGHQIVTFRLGDDLFAADINDVERVLRYAVPTPVPNVPQWVQGVIEYRSRVVPVIDLRVRFELQASAPTGATRIMVLASEGEWIAAVVDAVLEVVPIGTVPLAPPPPLFKGMAADFLRGILRRKERLIIVLDVTRLLATKDRLAFDRAVLTTVPLSSVPIAEAAVPASTPKASAVAAPVNAASETPSAAPEPTVDPGIIRDSSHGPEADVLHLLGTSDEPPQPDESILRGGPALPSTPEWGAPSSPRPRGPGSEDGGTGHSDG
jgi:purine-binding chemotaxis protein CheW